MAFRPPARVTVVAGKGGVGKTTVCAALGFLAARSGFDTLVVEVEGTRELPRLFGHDQPLDYREAALAEPGALGAGSASLRARTITPDDALVEYLEDHGLKRVSKRLAATGTLDVIATAVPGIRDILVLGKVKQIEVASATGAEGAPEVIVVDAPAAGHAVTFLASAYGLVDATAVGPIRTQAQDVIDLLSDPVRCQALLVTLAEETPVNEVVDTAYLLEDRAGMALAPVVVNALWPELDLPDRDGRRALTTAAGLSEAETRAVDGAAEFRRRRQELQRRQVDRLSARLPLPQLRLPYLFTPELGLAEVTALADALGPQWAAVGG